MASNRIGRINEEIQRELSELLRSLKDPRVQKTMISVTRVDTTNDLRYAKVYVSIYDKDLSKEVLKGLKSSGGYLRHELAERLSLRYTPELVWEEDNSITYGARVLDILSKLDIPADEPENAEDGNCDENADAE
ncbi:MAG: 30S ribosome-binding factor RbfA [Oscillospiraceae bacterium]|jgi:ribosome-binding factor A|nr:30S ribosome-binding factor RbfA [Oscillospiraceae bacterium]